MSSIGEVTEHSIPGKVFEVNVSAMVATISFDNCFFFLKSASFGRVFVCRCLRSLT